MAYGRSPFTRDYLDALIERRLRGGNTAPLSSAHPFAAPDTVLRRQPAGGTLDYPENQNAAWDATPVEKKPNLFKGALAQALDSSGQLALAGGLEAAKQGGGRSFGDSFLDALAGSLGTGAKSRAKEKGDAAKQAMDLYKLGLEARRTKAAETSANRGFAPGSETTTQELESQKTFLKGIGYTDPEIKEYFKTKGLGGRGGAGKGLTDLDKVAHALVSTRRAKNLDSAYVMARTILQQPQAVGSVERTELGEDANGNLTQVTRRVQVHRRINPETGMFEEIDDSGNLITPEERQTFMGYPMAGQPRTDAGGEVVVPTYSGGTGGPANPQPTPPGGPVGGSSAPPPAQPMAPVPSHAPMPGMSDTDFVPGPGGYGEQDVMNLLQQAQHPETLRAYAAGRGPGGNSTMIKALAAELLRRMGTQ